MATKLTTAKRKLTLTLAVVKKNTQLKSKAAIWNGCDDIPSCHPNK